MFKFLSGLFLLIILVLLTVLLVQKDPGFVLIKYDEYSLETSLAFGIVAVAVAAIVIQLVFRLFFAVLRLPKTLSNKARNRRVEKSRKLLNQGLIDLAEGRFEQSEQNLTRLIEYSENPLINYLAAARAAQQQKKHAIRDEYLKSAHEARPDAEIAISVTQAELQLSHKQSERALATLNYLRGIAPKHNYVLKLLAIVYFDIGEWSLLSEILPEVRKKNLLSEDKQLEMEHQTYIACLEVASKNGKNALEKAWQKIPKASQNESLFTLKYVQLMLQHEADLKPLQQMIAKTLDQQWDDQLIRLYGKMSCPDPSEQLAKAESWLNDYAQNETLLLALGRIAIRAKLWGKGQSYLEASIGIKPLPGAYLELAKLCQGELQQQDKANEYYQMGLELCLES